MRHRRQWLADQINRHGFTRVAELGVRDGRTYGYLVDRCPNLQQLIGVDLFAPVPRRPGVPGAEHYEDWPHDLNERTVRQMAARRPEVCRVIKATTAEAARQVPDGSLDLVFVDADHTTEGVLADLMDWTCKLRGFMTPRPAPTQSRRSILCGHDIHWPSVRAAVAAIYPDFKEAGVDNVWYRWL